MSSRNYESLIATLEAAPEILVPLVLEMPEERRKRRRDPKKWSAHEHFCHLADVQPMFLERLDLMRSTENARITPFDPDEAHEPDFLASQDLDDAVRRLRHDRAEIVTRLKTLRPGEWERGASHPEYDQYSIFILFRHVALHDLLHGYRIEELVLDPAWK